MSVVPVTLFALAGVIVAGGRPAFAALVVAAGFWLLTRRIPATVIDSVDRPEENRD